jgi:hypothetical protein
MAGPESGSPRVQQRRQAAWPLALLVLGLLVSALIRLPLILNANSHLDSDLAVDGLTLVEAAQGHWRWHFPGTPHVGTGSLVLLLPLAWIGGATPAIIGVGGALIYGLAVIAVFLLALRVFGPRVAAWSLIPLAFASTGTIWLSGRITGGHLLALAWHAVAFFLLYANLSRGGLALAAALGLWCGLGLWNDWMFLMTLVGLVPAGVAAWWLAGRSRRGIVCGVVFCLACVVGLAPKAIGRAVDPYDAYNEQFSPLWLTDVLLGHARILRLDCLPRLIVGHRLPSLAADPGGIGPDGQALQASGGTGVLAVGVVVLGLSLFMMAVPGLAFDRGPDPDRSRWAVRWGLLVTTAAVLAGFVINRNIFNSDNYRYLVFLLVPWAIGFGRLMDGLSRRGQGGAIAAVAIGLGFAALFSLDAADWYRRLGWLDRAGRPVIRPLDDPMLGWLVEHPEATHLYGGYWDVYRLSFLTGGRVKGVPSGHFPNRFPEWSTGLPGGHPAFVLARPTAIGVQIRDRALRDGGRDVYRAAGGAIVSWP